MYISPELRHWELHRLRGSGEASEGRSRSLQGVHRVPAPGPLFVKRLFPMKEYCQEQEYFQRSLIEEQYGKALVKLAKSATGREEISAVRPAWDEVLLKLGQSRPTAGKA